MVACSAALRHSATKSTGEHKTQLAQMADSAGSDVDREELALVSAAVRSLLEALRQDVVALRARGAADERALLENARATALQVTRLVELVEGRGASLFGAEESDGLVEAAGALREAVLGLLQCAKSSFEHPLDFVRSQQLDDAGHAVQQGLIRLEGRFDALKHKATGGEPPMANVAGLVAAFIERVRAVEAAASEEDDDGRALQSAMREAVLALRSLCEAAGERENECRELIGALQALLESAREGAALDGHVAMCVRLASRLCEKKVVAASATARELAEEAVQVIMASAPGVALEWSMVEEAEQQQVVGAVEKLVAEFLKRRAIDVPSPLPQVATLARGRSVTVKPAPTSRLRATTGLVPGRNASLVAKNSNTALAAKDALAKFLGVNDMRQWNTLLEEGSPICIVRSGGGGSSCEQIVRDCLAFVLSANAAAISKKSSARATVEQAKTLADNAAAALQAVREALPDTFSPEVEELLVAAMQRAAGFDVEATQAANTHVLSDPEPFRVFSGLLKQVHGCSKQLRATCIHLTTALQARHRREGSERLSERMAALAPSLVLQIAAAVVSLAELMATLSSIVFTVRSLPAVGSTTPPASLRKIEEVSDKEFWTETLASPSSPRQNLPQPTSPAPTQQRKRFAFFRRGDETELPRSKSRGEIVSPSNTVADELDALPKRGTLNQLIEAATHARLYAPLYMQAFIATLHSFSNSATVLRRLLERYECPATLPAAEREAIQMRVALVIKYWLETQPDDFDDAMLARLERFAKSVTAADMSGLLTKELARLSSNRKNRRAVFEAPPTEFGPLETIGIDSPADLLAKVEPSEIGRQLTLLDFALFSAIESVELQGQVWSNPKVQHRAPHVVGLVSRLNRVSYWTATTILLQDSDEARTAAVARFIEVAKFLRSVNNFHTLMGIVAGLNMAAVSKNRLKLTWSRVEPHLLSDFAELETLMSPSSSFKNYRAALRHAKPPAMPYMGSVCGDLTFIDEGNPDTIDGLVNFEKRLQVYSVLQEVSGFARTPYTFAKVEPFHSLFTALPVFGDKDLYSLSLSIEHRPNN
jgi:hypothetical protein